MAVRTSKGPLTRAHIAKLEALYAELPDVPCTGQCFNSCSFIGMSEAEHQHIKNETGVAIEMQQAPCPALDFAGRCSIHPLRPLICRLFGASEELRCEYGCQPERWLTPEETSELVQRAQDLCGPHDAEGTAIVAAFLRAVQK
jgi:Fe-S-cluster containining protein